MSQLTEKLTETQPMPVFTAMQEPCPQPKCDKASFAPGKHVTRTWVYMKAGLKSLSHSVDLTPVGDIHTHTLNAKSTSPPVGARQQLLGLCDVDPSPPDWPSLLPGGWTGTHCSDALGGGEVSRGHLFLGPVCPGFHFSPWLNWPSPAGDSHICQVSCHLLLLAR